MAGDEDLVAREELTRLLLRSRLGVVWDVRGIPGAGKSVLLRDVQRRARPDDIVVLVEMQDYFTAYEQGEAAAGVAGGAGAELRRFARALSAVVNALRDDSPAVRTAVEGILNAIGREVRGASELSDAQAHERAGKLIALLRVELSRMIAARAATDGRMYLLVDTFELVIDRPLGQWFLRLLDGLDGSVVAVARRAGPAAASLREAAGIHEFGELEVLQVDGLTPEQVDDYLRRRLGTQGGELAAAVHRFTGGHALSVGLTADLAVDMCAPGEPLAADGAFGNLIVQLDQGRDDDPEIRLSRLVNRFIESANRYNPAIGHGLESLWAVRQFDFPLLERLLAAGGEGGGYRLAERLVGYSFVERRAAPDRPAEHYYVVHDRVRQQGRAQLVNTTRLQALVEVAQAYYQDQATESLNSYDRWFRYEDPGWQAIAREWLYHVGQLAGEKRTEGRLGVAVLFSNAFWWYGNYVSFPFCEELLTDWAEMADAQGDKTDISWGNWLRDIYALYPKGWQRETTRDNWRSLRQRLVTMLQERPELRNQNDKRVRHVRGLLDIYLAEAERFLDPQSRRVEQQLHEARELFVANDDEWDAAWVHYQRADAALGRGDAQAAVAIAKDGWRDLTEIDDDDFELAANLHRIHADAAWARGERGLALDLYARAVLSAYKFQIAVGDPDIPPVDEYTQAFMTEMHERTAARLAELHAAGDRQAVRDACARIRRFFGPYWRAAGPPAPRDPVQLLEAGRAVEAVGQIFPPAPAPADLRQLDTDYAHTAGGVLYDMRDDLEEPPGTPLYLDEDYLPSDEA